MSRICSSISGRSVISAKAASNQQFPNSPCWISEGWGVELQIDHERCWSVRDEGAKSRMRSHLVTLPLVLAPRDCGEGGNCSSVKQTWCWKTKRSAHNGFWNRCDLPCNTDRLADGRPFRHLADPAADDDWPILIMVVFLHPSKAHTVILNEWISLPSSTYWWQLRFSTIWARSAIAEIDRLTERATPVRFNSNFDERDTDISILLLMMSCDSQIRRRTTIWHCDTHWLLLMHIVERIGQFIVRDSNERSRIKLLRHALCLQ